MKKIVLAVLFLSLAAAIPAYAEEMNEKEMPGMPGKMGMPGPGCMGMGCKASMVATQEGGVIVLAGNKLTKYDANLNVVKEVELKLPMGGKMCPMKQAMEKEEVPAAEARKKVS